MLRRAQPQPAAGGFAANHHAPRSAATHPSGIWTLIHPTTPRTSADQGLLAELLTEPALATTYALVQRFRTMVQQRDPAALDAWLTDACAAGIPEVATFAEGLKREHASISAALELPYSNGPGAGHVTRLKQIRRAMYGRGSFDLVRKRFLATA
jgi:transposase